jgi:hypothetical protein
MKHPSSREMFRYWNELRGRRFAPERKEIDPAAVRKALGDSLVLSFDRNTGHPIRLAGTRVCALFCRELKALPFVTLWDANSRPLLRSLVVSVTEEATAIVAGAVGRTWSGASVPLEILLLPLARGISPDGRLLGVLAPLVVPYWIGISPIKALTLGAFRHVLPDASFPPDRASTLRKVRPPLRFVVYEGGAARNRRTRSIGTPRMIDRACALDPIGSAGRLFTPGVNVVRHKFVRSDDGADE